ncbi:putative 2-octaprenyl-6-methoxyphenol hydroxylase [Streptomyces sp. NBRC 110611]|nr:putative 2-octaprenyl-6-methoxyphenol hydroxylase [Streptomyces sp. NBRC 110611]
MRLGCGGAATRVRRAVGRPRSVRTCQRNGQRLIDRDGASTTAATRRSRRGAACRTEGTVIAAAATALWPVSHQPDEQLATLQLGELSKESASERQNPGNLDPGSNYQRK